MGNVLRSLSHGTEVLPVIVPESNTNDVRATVYGAKFKVFEVFENVLLTKLFEISNIEYFLVFEVFEYSRVLFAHPY